MSSNSKRTMMWLVLASVVLAGITLAFWPRALAVDLVAINPGPMVLSLSDEGETRIVDVFVVSAPISGRLRRIEVESGDVVEAGKTIVLEIEPSDASLLDPRSEAEAQAQLSAAISAEALAKAQLEKAQAEAQFAQAELERAKSLVAKGTIAQRDLEAAERSFKTRRAATGVAQAELQVRRFELERVRAQLMSPEEMASLRRACECVTITSPIDGRVLRVLRESEGFIKSGDGVVEIGNPEQLEVVVDLLSTDAVQVRVGQRAFIDNWGGNTILDARVRRVEPFGYTKVSALGIEEQRVNVVLDFLTLPAQGETLGHGFQVDANIVLWEDEAVLKVPLTALFRVDKKWAVFVSNDGKAMRRIVEVGQRTDSEAQILAGLSVGEQVVVYPGEAIYEGLQISAR